MEDITSIVRGLEPAQIAQFITDGFVRIDHAFSRELADAARAILWEATGCSPDDPTTWTQPVIRLGMFTEFPFIEAANTPRLHAAFDQLVGQGRWRRAAAIGTFPVRFPSAVDPGDAGWHIDVSFGTDTTDFMSWRANIRSKGRLADAISVFRRWRARCTDAHPGRITRGHRPAARARRRTGADAEGTRRQLYRERTPAHRHRHGRRRHGVPLSSILGACGAATPGQAYAIPGAAPLLPIESDIRLYGDLNPVEQATERALSGAP
jgi:hypothetical protein